MIVRGPRAERNFTVIRNDTLRDERLSFKARGLLAFILSQEPGYRISAEELAGEGPDGRDAIRSALREMEAAGYLVRQRRRIGEGRIVTDSVLYEVPPNAENPPLPETENPSSVPPAVTPEIAGQTDDGSTDVGEPAVNRRTGGREVLKDFLPAPPAEKPQALIDLAKPRTPRPRDPIWDALMAAVGCQPSTKSERGAWNAAVKQLREVEASAGDVEARCAEYRRRWPGATLSPAALVKHWSALGVPGPVSGDDVVSRSWRTIAAAGGSP